MSKVDFNSIIRTCYMCPSQWEGKLDDGQRMFYARLRHGYFYLEFSNGPCDDVMKLFDDCKVILEFEHPYQDGFMTNFEFYRTLLKHNLLSAPRHVIFAIKYFGWLFQKLEELKDVHEWNKSFRRIKKHGFFGEKDED